MTSSAAGRAWPAHSVLGELAEEDRARFLRQGVRRDFARGDVIISESDHSTEVYLIMSGFVRIVNYTAAGEQAMIAIRTRGDIIGELAALDGNLRTSTAIAATGTVAVVIDGPAFRELTAAHLAIGAAVSRSVVGKLRTATRYRVETGQASVLARVARVLEHLADRHGRPVSAGILLDLPLPQQDLASLVASSAKGVGRAYRALKDAGAITVSYRAVIIRDLPLLQRIASGATGQDGDRPEAPDGRASGQSPS